MADVDPTLNGLLGTNVSGDLGELTLWTSKRGRLTAARKNPPHLPSSPDQLYQQDRFRQAQAYWSGRPTAEKLAWEAITFVLSLPLTGQNLVISLALRGDKASLDTLIAQSGVSVPMPPRIL